MLKYAINFLEGYRFKFKEEVEYKGEICKLYFKVMRQHASILDPDTFVPYKSRDLILFETVHVVGNKIWRPWSESIVKNQKNIVFCSLQDPNDRKMISF